MPGIKIKVRDKCAEGEGVIICNNSDYTVVWDLGDVGIGLMTIFNLIALYPLSGEAIEALRDYEHRKHLEH